MKILPLLAVSISSALAFAPRSSRASRPLQAEKEPWNAYVNPVLASLMAWSLAGQIATASLPMNEHPTVMMPSTTLAEKIVEMDFSLPSYSDSVKGSDISKGKAGVPSFNPFGDFEPAKVDRDSSSPSETPSIVVEQSKPAAVDRKAAAAAEKAAAEAKKADEKAAAEAKKIEKEARLKVEREKQKAAMERSKQEEVAASAPDVPSFKAPQMPEFKAPDFSMPDTSGFKMPDTSGFKMPDTSGFKMPDTSGLTTPKFSMPDTSSFKAPDMPKFTMPDTSSFKAPDMPKFDMPDTSGLKAPDMPKFSFPKNEYIDLDQMPKFDAPKISLPSGLPSLPSFGGGSSSSDSAILDSQDVRDERARGARQVYLQYDTSAKEVEAQAREARNLANEKKKAANTAKDEACQTKPGGKWICLRNPFTAGF